MANSGVAIPCTGLLNPPSNPIRVASKLRTGPGALIVSSRHVPPPGQTGMGDEQRLPGALPATHTPMRIDPGGGNGWKSGGAGGMGPLVDVPVEPVVGLNVRRFSSIPS